MSTIYGTSEIWAAIDEHQDIPGDAIDLFDHIAELYGVMPVYTLTYDQEDKPTYEVKGYDIVNEHKYNLFLIKYNDHID